MQTSDTMDGLAPPDDPLGSWVSESRFGLWFQDSWMWTDYVLRVAIEELVSLIEPPVMRAPLVVDAGCGSGHSFAMLEQHLEPKKIIGVEVHPQLIDASRRAADACPCIVDVQHGNVEEIELDDNSADVVFCHQTLHHAVNQSQAAAEFYRVLKPGGVLLLSESCRDFIESSYVRTLFTHPDQRPLSADEFLDLIGEVGFEWRENSVSRPRPFWTKPDWGLTEMLGIRWRRRAGDPVLHVAATKPGGTG